MYHSDAALFASFPATTVALVAFALLLFRADTAFCDTSTKETVPPTTNEIIALTVLFDNYPYDEKLKTGWGFALLVRGLEKTILFDTGGDGRILLSNMEKLDVNPADIDIVVLSHIHGDHTGGLEAFLAENHNVTVFVPASFPERFKRRVRAQGASLISVGEPCKICEGAQTTGQLGTLIREQALCISTSKGLFVVTGCAHPGIVRMVEAATKLSLSGVYGAIGGFHMSGASEKQVCEVIDNLKGMGVEIIAPCHCSGDRTRAMMREAFEVGYINVGVGAVVKLDSANASRKAPLSR